jgi:formate dehydrogenase subunit beta
MTDTYLAMQRQLQQITANLLQSQAVDRVIGYTSDPVQKRAIPIIIHHPEDSQQLVWNDTCIHNLAVVLKTNKPQEALTQAIILKGCDVRTVLVLLQEEQISQENIVIIAIDCTGMKDTTGNLLLKCSRCTDHRPPRYDHLIENPSVNVNTLNSETSTASPSIHIVESLPRIQRLEFWKQQANKCIRCYACREICPLCYCPECFTDRNLPQYISATPSLKGNFSWLLLRAFDLAGRCTGCMECDRVCPQNIPLHLLNMNIANDIKALFQYEPGRTPITKPLFNLAKDEDPNKDIL